MITLSNISLNFGGRAIYDGISFQINKGNKIGLAGKNGAGKSTLFKVIMRLQLIDSGSIQVDKGIKIAYLPQTMHHDLDSTVMETVLSGSSEIAQLEEELKEVERQVTERTDYESDDYSELLNRLSDLHERYNLIGGVNVQEDAEKICKGLGFEDKDFNRKLKEFSGGWKMRAELGKLLLSGADILLMDEPINHLDIESIQWLERFLKTFSGSILLTSHDKVFLDNITNRTIEIRDGKIYDYPLPYSKYLVQREEERRLQLETFKNQQKYIEQTEKLIDKFRAKNSKASFAQSLIKKLDKLDVVEVEQEDNVALKVKFDFQQSSGRVVADFKSVTKSYPDKTIFKNMDLQIIRGDKVALIGKNGLGKSTLVKVLTKSETYEGDIEIGHNVSLGYFAQDEADKLNLKKTVFETIDDVAEGDVRIKIRAILGSFMFSGEDVDKKVSVLSGGERTRLALCKLLLKPYNFLVLDEPTNHLDIPSKQVLKEALSSYTGTLLLISHDRDFLDGLTNKVFEIKDKRVVVHFDSVKDFLAYKEKQDINEQIEAKQANKKEIANTKSSLQDEKKIKNQVAKIEREIEDIENNLVEIEKEISEFPEKSTELFLKYEKTKKELDAKMKEWEQGSMLLG